MNILVIRICGHVSGAEIYNFVLLKEFRKYKDIKLSFITNLSQFAERVSEFDSNVICLPVLGREVGTKKDLLLTILWLPIYWLLYLVNIRRLEEGSRLDLICLQSMTEKIFLTPILRLFCYKVLWVEHGPLFGTPRSGMVKAFYKLSSSLVHKIIAVSNDTREDLINGGISEGKVVFTPIGVDVDYFKPFSKIKMDQLKKNMKIPRDKSVISFVGSVTKEKGIKEFIKLSEDLLKTRVNAHFLVVGEGPLLDWTKTEINDKKYNSNFTFTGFVKDVRNYLGISDILVFLSTHNEGSSISLLESLSMGVLVMASNRRGNLELVEDKKTGYIFNPKNVEIVKKRIVDTLNNPENSLRIKKSARSSIIERYNINNQAREFVSLFKSI